MLPSQERDVSHNSDILLTNSIFKHLVKFYVMKLFNARAVSMCLDLEYFRAISIRASVLNFTLVYLKAAIRPHYVCNELPLSMERLH